MADGSSEDDMEPEKRTSAHRAGLGAGDSKPPSADTAADIPLVYDRECPACDTYCRWVRVRPPAGRLHLVNARESTAAKIGRAHVCTPVTNAHIVCRLLLAQTNTT